MKNYLFGPNGLATKIVHTRYVIPPVELPVIQTTVFCCLSADFLPPANESHCPRKGQRSATSAAWCFE